MENPTNGKLNKTKYKKYRSASKSQSTSLKKVELSQVVKKIETVPEPVKQSPNDAQTVYFNDGERKIDYVLVYSRYEVQKDRYKLDTISTYVSNIKLVGLQTEEEEGLILDDLVCVKIHAPRPILIKYTNLYRIELSQNNPNYKYSRAIRFKFMRSIVTCPNVDDPVYHRAPDTLSGNPPTDYTDAERIYIVNKILSQIHYSSIETEFGFQRLVTRKILLAVYPLHDSLCDWPKEGPVTNRQLLARYWATVRYCYKFQPFTIIERYYGPAVAYYFAWLGFYTKMLFPAAVLGVLCFVLGIAYFTYVGKHIDEEVCESNQLICPVCPSDDWCQFSPLRDSCLLMKIAIVLENPATVLYSIIMSFWGVIFMVTWKRKQRMLRVRWNLREYVDTEPREEFIRTAPLTRISSITGNKEYYYPFWHKLRRHILSHFVIFIMLCIYCLSVIVVIYYRLNIMYYGRKTLNVTFKKYLSVFETITSAFMTFIIMVILDKFKERVSRKLTELENPRTQLQYDRSYTIKVTILSFGNTFLPIAYLAFFKGHFYTHPGDETQWTFSGLFQSDVCKMSGCLLDLSITLAIIMIFKNGMRMFTDIMIPVLNVYLERFRATKDHTSESGTQWEEDFILVQPNKNFLYSEYSTMVLQYGFMTFFLVSLPIAPLLAFINNLFELRLDALKMLKKYRRIVPKNVSGIGEWNSVLQVITILGAISNPLLIAFGGQFISRSIYWLRNDYNIKGFVNSTLSDFSVADYPGKFQNARSELGTCQYPGLRNPPSHPEKYQLDPDYWYQFAVKSMFFMILENICLLFSLFLKHVIPEIPRKVQLKLEYDQNILVEDRLRGLRS